MARNQTRLTPGILADDTLLGEAIDKILLADDSLQRSQRQVVRRQRELRRAVDDEQWHSYMLVEEAFNACHATALSIVARAFFRTGRLGRQFK
jgi:hypothetical protein